MVEIERQDDCVNIIVRDDEIERSRYRATTIHVRVPHDNVDDFRERLGESLDESPVPLGRDQHTSTWTDRETAEWIVNNL